MTFMKNELIYNLKLFKRFLKYYLLNRNMHKNSRLRMKACASRNKAKILIIAQFPEVWNSVKSVYEEAVNDRRIEIKVLCVPKYRSSADTEYRGILEENDMYDFLISQNIQCIRAYDQVNGSWYDLESDKPDYVIYTRPYSEQIPLQYTSAVVCAYTRTCFIPYAYNMLDSEFHITFNPTFITNINYVFTASKSRQGLCKREYYYQDKFKINQFIYMGFPRFDLFSDKEKGDSDHNDFIIAWMPRWSVKSDSTNKKSHFLDYYMKFLEFAGEHQNVKIIIRPHPLMFQSMIEEGVLSAEDINRFIEKCKVCGNITIDKRKDYMPLVRTANVLIADYTSLLIEFFVTGKPVIYCDTSDGLNEEAVMMDRCMYHAERFSEIEMHLNAIQTGYDSMRQKREECIEMLIPKDSCIIGKRIINYLIQELYK